MHEEILTDYQTELLPLIKSFSTQFGLVGGTAIALQIGHRRSIDFDLFTIKNFSNTAILNKIVQKYKVGKIFADKPNELTILINNVKLTLYKYPFDIKYSVNLGEIIKMPDLLTLASMKAHALGRRAKWKDYVDLYFIFKKFNLRDIVKHTKNIFKGEFSEKLLREQLAYYEDIDYSEKIDFLKGFEVGDEEIKKTLTEVSLQK